MVIEDIIEMYGANSDYYDMNNGLTYHIPEYIEAKRRGKEDALLIASDGNNSYIVRVDEARIKHIINQKKYVNVSSGIELAEKYLHANIYSYNVSFTISSFTKDKLLHVIFHEIDPKYGITTDKEVIIPSGTLMDIINGEDIWTSNN